MRTSFRSWLTYYTEAELIKLWRSGSAAASRWLQEEISLTMQRTLFGTRFKADLPAA
jgi:hypothetical protein